MNSEVMQVPIFTGIILLIAVILGVTIGRKRRRKIMERIAADTTEQQVSQILKELFPTETTYIGVPCTVGLTSGQLAGEYGKDFAKSAALSLISGRKVRTYSDNSGDSKYILAYGGRNLYLISILKNYNEMKLSINREVPPLHLNAENVEKFKYKSSSGTATVVLKNKNGKFSITPGLQFFDKLNKERKQQCKEFLKRFSEEF
jgi:hypothetical protein